MTMSKTPVIFIYFISIMFFINFNSPFLFWIFTELNLMIFVCLMMTNILFKYKQEMKDLFLFYFIIQTCSSLFLLLSFFLSSQFFILNSDFFFLISMLIKLGIFPFFYWVFKISDYINSIIFSLLLSLQKMPFFLFLFNNQNSEIYVVILASFLSGAFLILFCNSFCSMFVSSSISYSFWIYYIYSYSNFLFFLFFFIYFMIIFSFFSYYNSSNKNSFNLFFSIIMFMFFLGLSPLCIFFFKFLSCIFLTSNLGLTDMLIFWLISFLSLIGYLKFSFHSIFFKFEIYSFYVYFNFKMFMFFFLLLMFFFFLIY